MITARPHALVSSDTTVVSIDFITHLYVVSTKVVCYLSCGDQITTEFAQSTKII